MSELKWNPYYLVYCKENNRSPEEQQEHDRAEWPGGCMAGFTLWLREQELDFASDCRRKGEEIPNTEALATFSDPYWKKKFNAWLGVIDNENCK